MRHTLSDKAGTSILNLNAVKIDDKYYLRFALFLIAAAASFVVLAAVFLPTGERIFSEVATETVYLGLAIYTFVHFYRMGRPAIVIGWSLFCFGLALDLTDEVADVSGVLHKNLEDWVCMIGIFIFAVGFHRSNITLTRSLNEEQERAEELADQAFTDELTGIANRAYLFHELQIHIDKGKRFCVYFIDLNKFKPANDTYGHEVGDLLLQAVAQRLNKHGRKHDVLARWGGDEFIFLLSFDGAEFPDPMIFAQRLEKVFEDPFHVRDYRIELGASVGFAIFPEHADSREELVHKADLAMYHSKNIGEGPCAYHPELLEN